MNWYCVLTDIIIPLVSALLGGLLTILGVKMTITAQNKKKILPGKSLSDLGLSPARNMFRLETK